MKIKQPTLGLISCTDNPVETLFAAWAQSRPTQYTELFEFMEKQEYGDVVTPDIVCHAVYADIVTEVEIDEVFKKVIAMSIPVSESIHLTWGFTSMPIEWREQAVRKRQWGFWMTSMREFGMDDFVTAGRYAPPVPGSVPEDNGGLEFFHDFMKQIEVTYNKLKHEFDWPQEIARKVIPSCATHNGTMFSTFRTLLDTLSSRSCFVAQVDLWAPVLTGIVSALKEKHPLMGMIVSPPCFDRFSDEYKGCKYKLINENRLTEKDPYAPCPLYCMNDCRGDSTILQPMSKSEFEKVSTSVNYPESSWIRIMEGAGVKDQYIRQGQRLLPIWSTIWQRDPFTGILK